jgi:hypothetical protein
MNDLFRKLAHTASEAAGSPWAFTTIQNTKNSDASPEPVPETQEMR